MPSESPQHHPSRRQILGASALAAGAGLALPQTNSTRKPHIILIIADQVRADAVGAYGANPMGVTPNLDSLAMSGTLFRNMFTNQPVCSPSRMCLFSGQYPATHGIWKNAGGRGIGITPEAKTLATECTKAGYSANYIGKWHLAEGTTGPVVPAARGGFLGLWQASNLLELTSGAFAGDMWDGDGHPIHFENEYRANFLTRLTKSFLDGVSASSPFLLVVSYLEPHQQNDLGHMVAPEGYAKRYENPFVPADLKFFPVPIPANVQGRSTLPLLAGRPADWNNEVFVQMSEYWVGRGLRTPEWTYALIAPRSAATFEPARNAPSYTAFQLYDNRADPHQLVNLAGRMETTKVEEELRHRLATRMAEAGDTNAELLTCPFPYA
jgi:arylsulfatase A-like enzyme